MVTKKKRLLSAAAVLLAAGAGCASARRSPDARSEILRLDAEWSLAAQSRDVDRVVSYWSDDAVVLAPGLPPLVGKAAIRAYVGKSFETPDFRISWTTREVVVAAGGDVAYAIGANRVTFPGPDGKPASVDGKAVTVWRRGRDGVWKCVIDIWNDSPSPP